MINQTENKAVGLLSERLALICGYSSKKATKIKWAAEYHDIGKFLLPQEILHKPDKLSPAEFEIMKMHTFYGAMLLSSMPGELGKLSMEIALMHHEWYNGQGYLGFKTSYFPMYIGIVSICDVYCALVSERAYKSSWTAYEALRYIENRAGTQFCPKIINAFSSLFRCNGCNDVFQIF